MTQSHVCSWFKVLAMFCICFVVLAASFAVAQETTGGIQGVVKDSQGAVIANATVEVSSPALIGTKKATTDSGGYYRFANLPPGSYQITVTAPSFGTSKQTGLQLIVGATPTVNFTLKAGVAETLVEVSAQAEQIDVSSSKVQSNVTKDIINGIPKGRSYQSVITFAPGARLEPLQDQRTGTGFQIDGASSTENSYLVEGQETSSVVRGTGNTMVPFEFVQEVQIKSSGFEAEYGGALGGVVNVIQKRGSNAWHGSVFTYYQGDLFNAAPSRGLRSNPLTTLVGRVPESPEYYQAQKDHLRQVDPGFTIGGPIAKDRLWFFGSFAPSFLTQSRTATFTSVGGPRTLNADTQTYNAFTRMDGQLWNRVRLFGTWQTQYARANGATVTTGSPALNLPTPDSVFGQRNNSTFSATTTPDQFNYGIGYRSPNVIYNTGADITINPALVATTRFGYFFTDLQTRGLPEGDRFQFLVGTTTASTDATGAVLPSNLVASVNSSNIGANKQQQFDKTSRRSFSQDVAYFKKTSFGTHNFKVGYAYNKVQENLLNGFKSSFTTIFPGTTKYTPQTNTGRANCSAIVAASGATYGDPAGTNCQGRYGYFSVGGNTTESKGTVGSDNQAIYVQDSWTVGAGLTINAGVRFDKEFLPSFKPGAEEISFDFADKFAPRIGASWDVFRAGKLKIYGSYGKFFDIMKYELPQGSFGGQYWHQCVYAMDNPNYLGIAPTRDASGNICPAAGASAGANGTIPAGNRLIENKDLRIPANDPSDSRIVKGIKPMEQHEMVFGADWAITPKVALETRYSRKRLDRTIEDIGALTDAGEAFFIGNPGVGSLADQSAICPGCLPQPPAIREYDGLEFRLTRRSSEKWFGTVSYTWSRLYGNYSGLSSTDEAGRVDPNVSRMFDEPHYQFDSHGQYALGPLATDRPHTVKGFGYYRLKWWNMETLVGATQQWFSGTPISTQLSSAGGTPQLVENRGNFADVSLDATGKWILNGVKKNFRTPVFTQTDLNVVQEFKVSKSNEAMRLTVEANILNLFNEKNILNYQNNLGRLNDLCPAPGCSSSTINWDALMHSGWDYVAAANATGFVRAGTYGLPNLFQTGRNMRFQVKFTF